ncbi:MAG: uroporphyrinogen-III C-methyltransferase [Planctomycetes bacterium]|nr:uroporphyrinogen-III C-methyltransferase [Planctomycetota bacterium]
MSKGTVYLVGAGPGHPGLLTLRAVECLRQADLVLYDKVVPDAILEHAPECAAKICVASLEPARTERHRPTHETMIAAARLGKKVVRLKSGDPFIFGRGGEEAQALQAAGIPFEIVPGVTAAQAAAAFAGIPLTQRGQASAVAFITGHEDPANPEASLDWNALARFPGTLAIYMGMSRLDKIVPALIAGGKDPGAPSCVVHRASAGDQRTVAAPLAEMAGAVRALGLTAPAIIIIGSVVSLREELSWFEKLPLFGKRVLVTRPRHQAGSLVQRLVELGATPLVLPVVEIRDPPDWSPVDRAIANLPAYTWLVFTSANGVHAFMRRLRGGGRDARALAQSKLAAIGPKTAETLRQYHLHADLVPEAFQSEHLAAALRDRISASDRVLLVRADRGRELLRQELTGVCAVEQIAAYSQVDAVDATTVDATTVDATTVDATKTGPASSILDQLRRGEIDFVTLTSSNIARAFLRGLDATCRARLESGETRLVSISPVTSADIRAVGFPVAAEARQAISEGLVEALIELVSNEANSETGRLTQVLEGVPSQVAD